MRISVLLKTTLTFFILLSSLPLASAHAQVTTCPNAPQPRLVIGRQAHVTPGSPNNLRAKPSKAAQVVVQVPGDTYVEVTGGPACADNMAWWQIQYGDQTGWMAEGSAKTYYIEPSTSPITTFTLSGNSRTVDVKFGGANLTYNGAFGPQAEATTVFAVKESGWDFAAPAYTNFQFPTKEQNQYRQPSLSIYPVADYQKINEFAGQQITALSTLLKAKPADPTNSIPSLPSVRAAQVFHSNVKYLPFHGGTGIRFITMYAQGLGPVTNDQLWCLFQGLTDNGKYFVTAWFPISSSVLAATYDDAKDFPDMGSSQAAELFTAYLKKVTAKLNSTSPGDFKPNLDSVDALLQSLSIQ